MHEVIARELDRVQTVDLATWFRERGLDDDRSVRPDGIHVEPAASEAIASEFLGWALVEVALGEAGP